MSLSIHLLQQSKEVVAAVDAFLIFYLCTTNRGVTLHTLTAKHTLHHIAHCNKLHHTAPRCTLHYTAPYYTTRHHTASHCNTLHHTATHYTTLQHTATHCNTLQHTATHCNTLHPTATHCTTLQHAGGATLRALMEETATKVWIPAESPPGSSQRTISISGAPLLQHNATHCNKLQHTANTHIGPPNLRLAPRNALFLFQARQFITKRLLHV